MHVWRCKLPEARGCGAWHDRRAAQALPLKHVCRAVAGARRAKPRARGVAGAGCGDSVGAPARCSVLARGLTAGRHSNVSPEASRWRCQSCWGLRAAPLILSVRAKRCNHWRRPSRASTTAQEPSRLLVYACASVQISRPTARPCWPLDPKSSRYLGKAQRQTNSQMLSPRARPHWLIPSRPFGYDQV